MSLQSVSESFLLPEPESDYSDLSVPFSKILRMYGRSLPHHDRTLSGLDSITTEMSDDESIDFTTYSSSQETLSAVSTLVSDASGDFVESPGSLSAFSMFLSKSSRNGSVASSRGNAINFDQIHLFEPGIVDRCSSDRNEEGEPNAIPTVESCFHRFIRFVCCRAPEDTRNDA
uniref:Autophagy-related protein 13 n=1 Tax=Panagrellus redivivus TaxID=6233 RepID=A0A7E4VFA3_PANRE